MAVWDCFTFNDELLLLELRLQLLGDVVDRFVLVEAPMTHQGEAKPLHYEQNRTRFAAWSDKIVHVVADLPDSADSPWEREHAQRRAIGMGLHDASPDDLVLVSDVDEIPRCETVEELRETLTRPTALEMSLHFYCFDLRVREVWPRARAARRSQVTDAQHLRLGERKLERVPDAGWHFSYLGDPDAVERKLAAFAHTEDAVQQQRDRAHVERCIQLGVDFLEGKTMVVVPDEDLPTSIRARREELAEYFHGPRSIRDTLAAHRYGWTTRARRRRGPQWVADHPVGAVGLGAGLAAEGLARSARNRMLGRSSSR